MMSKCNVGLETGLYNRKKMLGRKEKSNKILGLPQSFVQHNFLLMITVLCMVCKLLRLGESG